VLLLVAVLVGGPVIAIIVCSIVATVYVAPLIMGGGPLVTTGVFMVLFFVACLYSGIYVAPHVQPKIGKAVSALLSAL
jgi:hypothetical protein